MQLIIELQIILGVFSKLLKVIISFVMPVRLSIHLQGSTGLPLD